MSRNTITDTTVVEVHGNDGASQFTAAKHYVLKTVPNVGEVLNAEFGVGRCEHGNLLVAVTYTIKSPDDAA